jgi:hypothetical protein
MIRLTCLFAASSLAAATAGCRKGSARTSSQLGRWLGLLLSSCCTNTCTAHAAHVGSVCRRKLASLTVTEHCTRHDESVQPHKQLYHAAVLLELQPHNTVSSSSTQQHGAIACVAVVSLQLRLQQHNTLSCSSAGQSALPTCRSADMCAGMGWCAPARIMATRPGMSGASNACLPASSSNSTHLQQQKQQQPMNERV